MSSTASFALVTLIELAISITLIYGFMHEEKVVWLEENIKRIVIGNARRAYRKYLIKKAKMKGEKLYVASKKSR